MSICSKFPTLLVDEKRYVSAELINDQYKKIFGKSGSTQKKLIKDLKLNDYMEVGYCTDLCEYVDRSFATKVMDLFKPKSYNFYLEVNELKTPKEGKNKVIHIELLRIISLLSDIDSA